MGMEKWLLAAATVMAVLCIFTNGSARCNGATKK